MFKMANGATVGAWLLTVRPAKAALARQSVAASPGHATGRRCARPRSPRQARKKDSSSPLLRSRPSHDKGRRAFQRRACHCADRQLAPTSARCCTGRLWTVGDHDSSGAASGSSALGISARSSSTQAAKRSVCRVAAPWPPTRWSAAEAHSWRASNHIWRRRTRGAPTPAGVRWLQPWYRHRGDRSQSLAPEIGAPRSDKRRARSPAGPSGFLWLQFAGASRTRFPRRMLSSPIWFATMFGTPRSSPRSGHRRVCCFVRTKDATCVLLAYCGNVKLCKGTERSPIRPSARTTLRQSVATNPGPCDRKSLWRGKLPLSQGNG